MVRLFYEDSKKFLEKKWFDFKFSPKVIHNRMQQLFKFKFNHCLSEESVSVYMYFLFMQTACRIFILQVITFCHGITHIFFIKSKMQLNLGILLWAFTLGPDKLYPGSYAKKVWYTVNPDDSSFLLVSPQLQLILKKVMKLLLLHLVLTHISSNIAFCSLNMILKYISIPIYSSWCTDWGYEWRRICCRVGGRRCEDRINR